MPRVNQTGKTKMRYLCGTCALALLLTGCVTTQEQQLAADAARCRSYGAAPGTQAHLQCRMELDRQRQAGAAIAAAQGAQLVAIGAQMMQPRPAPVSGPVLSPRVTCHHYGNRTICN
jgi:hypothetical protein